MKIKIEGFVYPNHISVNQSAFVRIGKDEYEATIEAKYCVPEGATNMEVFVRTEIVINHLTGEIADNYGPEAYSKAASKLIKDAHDWTPVSINAHPNWQDAKDVLIAQLAVKFSKVLKKWLGKAKMQTVIERNSANDDNSCASHDFCDANMAMDEAFTKVLGREFTFNFEGTKELEQGNSDDTDLMNAAWSMAKANDFYIND